MKATASVAPLTFCCLLVAAAGAQQPAPRRRATSDHEALATEATSAGNAPATQGQPAAPPPKKAEPWKLGKAVGLPDWLELGGQFRARYESLDEQFRAGLSGSAQGVFTRTTLRGTARVDWFEGSLELIDSRQFDVPDDLPLDTTIVDTLDVLQAYVGARFGDVWQEKDKLNVLLGRHTMDVGSRRLVARNSFRNTINAFTGVNATWESAAGDGIRAFYVLPVQRLPSDLEDLQDNEVEFDEERSQVQFYGVHGTKANLVGSVRGELYAFGLDEEDGRDLATRNRDIWTFGTRFLQKPKAGALDFELEAAYQTGTSRSGSGASNTTDLDHRAEFVHASAGYLWDADLDPRLEVLFDYASGDDDPTDGDVNRFDTLFGARRFEFGPTGIFGAFARSNILSPGLRLTMKPTQSTRFMITDRAWYLASDQDAWTTSGLVDPAGDSGDYVGNMVEASLRWEATSNLSVEAGVAHLFAGEFVDDAPNATTQGDVTYGYVEATLSF